ncbi:hypothetical protein CFB48_19875 [Burkholderia sp. AU33647]|uniref:Uncharacterized protein n=1 Tax=Burkholderia contaminans TaxID=488447 RepID=A0A3N8PMQ6_9BURK|nr:hypothetical protein CFB48_19875 [Burkholderia sp. AU33647]RQT12555.1 hypothetical protein DF051_21945 [Burkholderia contaminans]
MIAARSHILSALHPINRDTCPNVDALPATALTFAPTPFDSAAPLAGDGRRKLWGIYLGQFALNSTLWFFLTWFPTYLVKYRGMDFLTSSPRLKAGDSYRVRNDDAYLRSPRRVPASRSGPTAPALHRLQRGAPAPVR